MSDTSELEATNEFLEDDRISLVQNGITKRRLFAGMAVATLPLLSGPAKSKTGPAKNIFTELADFKAQPVANKYATLVVDGIEGGFAWQTTNTPYTADDEDIIEADDAPLTIGAWIRTSHALETLVQDDSIPSPVILRKILLDAQVSKMLSAAGDGDIDAKAITAETAKIQKLCDTGRSFAVPEPSVTYQVNSIQLKRGQTIEGTSGYGKVDFTGNGVDPVFLLGDGGANTYREQTLRDMRLFNNGGPCVLLRTAPDFVLDRVTMDSTGANTIDGRLSVRGTIRDSRIGCSGPFTAIKLLDYFNGLVIQGVSVSGGSAGRAIQIGSTQGATLDGIRIEGSLDGMWIGSTIDNGDGVCSGISIRNFYVEQSRTPMVIAKVFSVHGLDASGIFISNNMTGEVAPREACIQLGRVSGRIDSMVLYPHVTEDLLWLYLTEASGGFGDFAMQIPRVLTTYANNMVTKGSFAKNLSVKSAVGAVSDFGLLGGADRLGSSATREWTSPLIDASVSTGILTIVDPSRVLLGGKVLSAEVIDYNGGILTDVQLAIGRTGSIAESVSVGNMDVLKFNHGHASLPLGPGNIFAGEAMLYHVITATSATAKFRIRIRYRAN